MTKAKRKNRRTIKGVVLHFGYVESGRVAPLILHARTPGYRTLGSVLTDLAAYFWEDYVGRLVKPETARIDEFERFLYEMPTFVASGGIGDVMFDREHSNTERWWPWHTLRDLTDVLGDFIEIPERAEDAIIWHLRPADEKLRKEHDEWKSARIVPDWKDMKRVGG